MKAILQKLYGNNKTKTELKKVELSAISEIRNEYISEARNAYTTFYSAIDSVMNAEESLARLFNQGPGLANLKDRVDELETQIKDLGIEVPNEIIDLREQITLASEYYTKMIEDNYSGILEGMRYDMVTLVDKLENLSWN